MMKAFLNFSVQIFVLSRRISLAEFSECGHFFGFIDKNASRAEHNHTTEICGKFFGLDIVLLNYTERYFVISFKEFNLMAFDCAMKVDFAVCIDITNRHCIRIIVFFGKCKNPGSRCTEYG